MFELPVEVLDQIIDYLSLPQPTDKNTLHACSLTFPRLRFLVQKRLFATVKLDFPVPDTNGAIIEHPRGSCGSKFLALISNPGSLHIAPYVETLVISVRNRRRPTHGDVSASNDAKSSQDIRHPCLDRLLPLLERMRIMRIHFGGVELMDKLDEQTHDAINDACRRQSALLEVDLDVTDDVKVLLPSVGLRGPIQPQTLRVGGGRDHVLVTLDHWIKRLDCPLDVTRLSRLEMQDFGHILPTTLLPLCASTLNELVVCSSNSFKELEESYERPHHSRGGRLEATILDLSLLRSLKKLELSASYTALPSHDHYTTTLPMIQAVLCTIPSGSHVSTIIIHIRLDERPMIDKERMMELDFSPLSYALITRGDGTANDLDDFSREERTRLECLRRLELVFHHCLDKPLPKFDEHPDLLPFKALGLLHVYYDRKTP